MSAIAYNIIIAGCGQIGSKLTKELCRFANSFSSKDTEIKQILLYDRAAIDASDVQGQEYLPCDIGWHKSATLAAICSEQYAKLEVHAYGEVPAAPAIRRHLQLEMDYSLNMNVTIVFDMSNGSRAVFRRLKAFFYDVNNCIIITPKDGVQTAVRLARTTISEPVASSRKKTYQTAESMRIVRVCLAQFVNCISNGTIQQKQVLLAKDGIGVYSQDMPYIQGRRFHVWNRKRSLLCICVGCGGTGGNFIKEFVANELTRDVRLSLLMIDGDRVESKNMERQPYAERDILQNKAITLARDLLEQYPVQGRIFAYPEYLDEEQDLLQAICTVPAGQDNETILLIGAVDNHRARQVMEMFFQSRKNIVYVDAANEWSNGEVVISVKTRGVTRTPLRSFYYPDVLTDTQPSASQQSCGAVNRSSPQHLCTNLTSAQNIMSAIMPLLNTGMIEGGIIYFDTFRQFSRFQPMDACQIDKEVNYESITRHGH